MLLHEAIKQHLQSDTSVEALLGGRFYYVIVPQSYVGTERMPCVVFNRSGVERQVRYCGTDGMIKTSFTLDCYALRYTSVRALANEVRKSLIDFRGLLGGLLSVSAASIVNEFDLLDIEPGLFRVSQSWDFWHIEEE
jgi:Protein of unknown function (DUF3168)